jgi:PilZ domain-containing protein
MAERRRSARQKSFLRGCVYFNKRRNAFDCLIRDISDAGARIIFSDTVSIPDIVDLYIPQKEQTVRAHVQWRHGDEIGLVFPDAVRAADGTPDGELALRVAELESQVSVLRRELKHLRQEIDGGDDRSAA